VTAGAETARLEGHSHLVTALCVLPDGRLASGSSDGTIRLWDVARGITTCCARSGCAARWDAMAQRFLRGLRHKPGDRSAHRRPTPSGLGRRAGTRFALRQLASGG